MNNSIVSCVKIVYNMSIETEVRKWGNSLGIVIPAENVREFNLQQGDMVAIQLVGKKRVNAFGIARGAKKFEEESFEHEEIT